jgi:hypothetical protein
MSLPGVPTGIPTDEVQLTQPTGEIHPSQRMIALLSAVSEKALKEGHGFQPSRILRG